MDLQTCRKVLSYSPVVRGVEVVHGLARPTARLSAIQALWGQEMFQVTLLNAQNRCGQISRGGRLGSDWRDQMGSKGETWTNGAILCETDGDKVVRDRAESLAWLRGCNRADRNVQIHAYTSHKEARIYGFPVGPGGFQGWRNAAEKGVVDTLT
ncbi:hypothetical protein BO70DRAFT_186673 [Aspergillus heteromorphus CBS 117.55]|uniref:Uncharacterized protein n=1 Tax=Aspergillus heteromorphus CBS 117.55 TaxID=1448321 RepID=A0A317UZD2_9EURO|nr:uncharacterized protein BO70DRAFT_186673 [Aspergillus heteromorphus CBS 117.55]PWY65300.1 hypothetical protein BO70DRAFT_186673 [Aspergillus heteromorphus CBS 117.55]